jgi:predicted RecA/RadA family phage recombinase
MAEALYLNPGISVDYTAVTAVTAGEVRQLSDGRAAFAPTAIAAGELGALTVSGIARVAKTTTMVMVKGSRVYWDASANKAHLLQVNDKDFYLGIVQSDAVSAATTVDVAINADPRYTLDLGDGFVSVPVLTAGLKLVNSGHREGVSLAIDTVAEAQKIDALSLRGWAVGTPCLVDILMVVNAIPDNAVGDINVGIANGTHATDADAITESMFVHFDNALDIKLESDDGTTEVNATDTTVDAVVGTPFLVQFDLRDYEDIQVYINGVIRLADSVFKLDAATGPLKLLAHIEKSGTDDTPGAISVATLGMRAYTE